jgi:hypothetical protein
MKLWQLTAPASGANHSAKAIWFQVKEDELERDLLGLQEIDRAPLV